MARNFHIETYSQKITRPIGGVFSHSGSARIYEDLGTTEKLVHELIESWGRTAKEAEDKARERANKWIEEHSK